jgi:acetyltransferase
MQDILACARARGVGEVFGDVLRENTTMLQMASELGFVRTTAENGVVRVSIAL